MNRTMNYSLVRLMMSIALIILFLIFKRKSFRFTIKKAIFLLIAIVVTFYALMFVRFENVFMNFPSAESVWRYENIGEEIKIVIEGDDSSLVIYTRENKTSYDVYPKTKDGWKLNTVLFEKTQFKIIGNPVKCIVTLCKTNKSKEYFIIVRKYAPYAISDNIGSEFKKINIDPPNTFIDYITEYAIVPVTEHKYELTIGDEKTVLDLK